MLDYFATLARYNAWANRRIYAAVGELDNAAIVATRTGFFPSLLKTLNHLVVADRIWLGRLTGQPETSLNALDEVLHPDFAELRAARVALDERLQHYIDKLDPKRFNEMLVYKTVAGVPHETPFPLVPDSRHALRHGGAAALARHHLLFAGSAAGTGLSPPPHPPEGRGLSHRTRANTSL